MSVLKSLLFPEVNQVMIGRVTEKLQDYYYLIRDESGKQYSVEATQAYSIGQSVSFKDGVILSAVKSNQQYTHYVV